MGDPFVWIKEEKRLRKQLCNVILFLQYGPQELFDTTVGYLNTIEVLAWHDDKPMSSADVMLDGDDLLHRGMDAVMMLVR